MSGSGFGPLDNNVNFHLWLRSRFDFQNIWVEHAEIKACSMGTCQVTSENRESNSDEKPSLSNDKQVFESLHFT